MGVAPTHVCGRTLLAPIVAEESASLAWVTQVWMTCLVEGEEEPSTYHQA